MALVAASMLLHKELASSIPTPKTGQCAGIASSKPPDNIFPRGADRGIQCHQNCHEIYHEVTYTVVKKVVIGCTDEAIDANEHKNRTDKIYNKAAKKYSIQCKTGFEALTFTVPTLYRNGDRLEKVIDQVLYCKRKS